MLSVGELRAVMIFRGRLALFSSSPACRVGGQGGCIFGSLAPSDSFLASQGPAGVWIGPRLKMVDPGVGGLQNAEQAADQSARRCFRSQQQFPGAHSPRFRGTSASGELRGNRANVAFQRLFAGGKER